jgi:putative transposase
MDTIELTPTNYPSDLRDNQWEQIAKFFPQGPNSEHHKRSLINAVLYLLDNGIKWRSMPHEYPPWSTVHSFYFRVRRDGIWEKVHEAIVRKARVIEGRNESPGLGLIDSQSVKTVYADEERCFDGGKNQGT